MRLNLLLKLSAALMTISISACGVEQLAVSGASIALGHAYKSGVMAGTKQTVQAEAARLQAEQQPPFTEEE